MKNHIIKSFRINQETYKLFEEASQELALPKSELSRLLFNRALKQLKEASIKAQGYSNLNISVKELKDIK